MAMRIEADTWECVSAGHCLATAPDIFGQSEDDGRVQILIEEPAENRRAAVDKAIFLCPSAALHWSEPEHEGQD
jgi:ferredoxin